MCPDCFGKLRLTVILGNGEYISIECAGCSAGYEPPRGYVVVYEASAQIQEMTISGIEVSQDEPAKYRSLCYSLKEENLFRTKEEADVRAQQLADEHTKEEKDRFNRKEKDTRTWAWNARYHRECIKRAEKDLVYHQGKLLISSAKAKEDKVAK